jgi:HSP20 family molecular chaperone IbpA
MSAAADPPFSNITRQANKLMEQMQKGYFNFCPSETWTPSVNLYETGAAYQVCVDLAGVEKEKIDVEVADHILKLRGSRTVPQYEEGDAEHAGAGHGDPTRAGAHGGHAEPQPASRAGEAHAEPRRIRVHLMEIDHGSFCREVELPENVDRDLIRASYRNGMLWIEIPKA